MFPLHPRQTQELLRRRYYLNNNNIFNNILGSLRSRIFYSKLAFLITDICKTYNYIYSTEYFLLLIQQEKTDTQFMNAFGSKQFEMTICPRMNNRPYYQRANKSPPIRHCYTVQNFIYMYRLCQIIANYFQRERERLHLSSI